MRRLLIVDDDASSREALAGLLQGANFDVVQAGNGQEALDYLERNETNLILLDLLMPVMNGWEFHRRQRKNPRLGRIPVVALTGARPGSIPPSIRSVLRKPVEPDVLLDVVDRLARPGQ